MNPIGTYNVSARVRLCWGEVAGLDDGVGKDRPATGGKTADPKSSGCEHVNVPCRTTLQIQQAQTVTKPR